ncbi:MAG: metallophosphoesterase [Gemmatimonadaceae bacterium]
MTHPLQPFRGLLGIAVVPLILGGSPDEGRRSADVSGVVFVDANRNGRRDAGEQGIAGVAVSDQVDVTTTVSDGSYRLATAVLGSVFVSVPDGYMPNGPFWRSVTLSGTAEVDFPLLPVQATSSLTFIHASDTHISEATQSRMVRLRALVDSIRPAFVIITGDLVRDALRVGEAEATGYYELFQQQAGKFTRPLFTVPGNHEIFGIERQRSGVSADHPLYGRAMYRHYRGPDYYSFNAGGVHFVGLNSIDIDDMSYFGHVDSLQLAWLARDLAVVSAQTPVVTFNHIPFFTAVESINGYRDGPPAPSVITVHGKSRFRHTVSNAAEVIARIKGHPYPLALGGHMHVREQLRYAGVPTRFFQTGAVVGPSTGAGLAFPSGITVYRVQQRGIDDGTFVPLGLDK